MRFSQKIDVDTNSEEEKTEPNKALHPTPVSVTDCADAPSVTDTSWVSFDVRHAEPFEPERSLPLGASTEELTLFVLLTIKKKEKLCSQLHATLIQTN